MRVPVGCGEESVEVLDVRNCGKTLLGARVEWREDGNGLEGVDDRHGGRGTVGFGVRVRVVGFIRLLLFRFIGGGIKGISGERIHECREEVEVGV